MAKIDVDVAISKVKDAFVYEIEGRTSVKKCLCIPVDSLSIDKKGALWLNFVGYDDTKFERQTHSLKQKLSKAQYDALPIDPNTGKKVYAPYCGTVKCSDTPQAQAAAPAPVSQSSPSGVEDDLPF